MTPEPSPFFSAIGIMAIYGTEQYFEDAATDRKSIIAPRSPGRPVTTHIEFEEACGDLLRRTREVAPQQLATAYLTVFIHTNCFLEDRRQYYGSETITLPVATSDTGTRNDRCFSLRAPIGC